jgi:hypothetical protein
MANYDDLKIAVEALTGGANTVVLDNDGYPSIMVRFDKKQIADLITGGSAGTHPAFIVNGVEVPAVYISKYQNFLMNNKAYSLPFKDPANTLTFDQAKGYSEAKGPGHHLMTNAEWAAVALWCRKNNLMPRGNNNYGKDYGAAWETGIQTYSDNGERVCRVATGSGPVAWSHDNTIGGIWDLNGNVYEWTGGYRTSEGEIQVIPDNNAAAQVDEGVTSTLWKAILENGSLVAPGTADTLKWDYAAPVPAGGTSGYGFRLNKTIANPADNDSAYGSQTFQSLAAAAGVTVPEILKALAVMPADSGDHGSDYIYMRNRGERLVYRGGLWYGASESGVFCMYGGLPRSFVSSSIGFRSAYIPGI